ncbi:DUF7507 domain-containing protein [Mongoliitalea daihaiensis]|uniref:DUF7507 domain-containing protein n=1 Tax=Mongoliitalea daihaiensis TaxID=2782006 RepID=UPI001F31614B|nr:gliding motility-associated C-terminal domain-containing protein [Mongoliitalea daihaiensis]UJP64576.1 DUF11 domain-containing protein [Mongoliitalea daihaiensis]
MNNSMKFYLFLVFLMFGALAGNSQIITPTNPFTVNNPACRQQNLTVVSYEFRDMNGVRFNPATMSGLEIGEPVVGQIWATWAVSGNGYNPHIQFDVLINGVRSQTIANCVVVENTSGQTRNVVNGESFKIADFTWNFGDKLEVENIYINWNTGAAQNDDKSCPSTAGNSQCSFPEVAFIVNTPLVANFDSATECENLSVKFTNLTTGGAPANYNLVWNFGDGNTSSQVNPTHTYASSGTYTVTLTASDGVSAPNTISRQVLVPESISIAGTVNPAAGTNSNGAINITVTGGEGNLTYSWTRDGQVVGTNQNLTNINAGTYQVRITDSLGCFVEETFIVPARLILTSFCSDDPTQTRRWRIRNTNSFDVEAFWNLVGDAQEGVITVPANSELFFETTTVSGSNTVTLFFNNNRSFQNDVKASCPDRCIIRPIVTGVCSFSPNSLRSFEIQNTNAFELILNWNANGGAETGSITLAPSQTQTFNLPTTANSVNFTLPSVCGNVATVVGTSSSEFCPPAIALVKSIGSLLSEGSGCFDPSNGELIYTFEVSNVGDQPLGNITIVDPLFNEVNPSVAINFVSGDTNGNNLLDTDEIWTYTASYPVREVDLERGFIENQATVTATFENIEVSDLSGLTVQDDTITRVDICQNPVISIGKTVDIDNISSPQTLTYTVTIRNEGNVNLTGVVVTDVLPDGTEKILTADGGESLAIGASREFTVTYAATQEDIDTGADIINNVGVTSAEGATNTDTATTTITRESGISIVKAGTLVTGNSNGRPTAGDQITYTFTVTNTGNVTLTNVVVNDPLVDVTGGPITTLAPGQVDATTFTAVYTLTQADINNTSFRNEATVTADFGGTQVEATDEDIQTYETTSRIRVRKTADKRTNVVAGDLITYTYVVRNAGTVTVNDINVTDEHLGTGQLSELVTADARDGVEPGQTVTFTATYLVTQEDIDRGTPITNVATATGTCVLGCDLVHTDDETITPIQAQASIGLAKVGTLVTTNSNGRPSAGDQITYTFTVTNTGNVTLTNVVVNDPLVDVIGGPITTLAPGQVDATTFTAVYALTQADINNTSFRNEATVTADFGGAQVEATDEDIQTYETTSRIRVRKTADKRTNVVAGDLITYTYVVRNAGTVTVNDINVTDEHPGTGQLSELVTADARDGVEPGQTVTFTATYLVTQEDIDRGTPITNVATATGTCVLGCDLVHTDDETITPIQAQASIGLAKVGTLVTTNSNGRPSAGDQITYTFTVTNTGNVTLTNVVVNDPLVDVTGGPITALAPGQVDATTFTAVYTLTQADINNTSFRNEATVTADFGGAQVEATDEDIQPYETTSRIRITKTADKTSNVEAGDVITYTYVVRNAGTVTVNEINVTDDHPGLGQLTELVTADARDGVEPGQTVTFTATYLVTQEDIDRGTPITNVATATGTCVLGCELVATDDETIILIASNPSIEIVKTDNGSTVAGAGDEINYTLTVTNTGNVTLENVVVNDELAGIINQVIGTLAPTAQVTLTATYTVDQADVDRGSVLNVATVGGNAPNGEEVGDDDSVETPIASNPSIEIVKTDNGSTVANAGDEINYTLTVTNTGNVTLENVVVNDELAGIINQVIGSLAPTAQVTLTATYTVDQADVDRGSVLNVATVGGNAPNGEEVGDDDSVETPIASNPSIEIVKTDNGSTVAGAGDEINYTLTVTNTGNVTLENVVVNDELAGIINQVIGSLAPTAQVTLTATYTVDQADVDRGSVLNVATVGGNAPNGEEVGDDDSVETPIASNPSIEIVKTDNGSTVAGAGDEINYTLTVTNTGNVTLENVVVNDELAGIINQVIGSLAPTAQVTLTATYTVDQADVDRGSVLNVATVGGNAPNGEEVGDDDSVETPIASNPSIEIVKTDNGSTVAGAGDEINYTLTVTNTGNVTLENVVVNDELAGIINQVIGTLAPTAQVTLTATYTVDQADVDRGSVLNVATVGGNAPNGEEVGDDDSVETPIASNPSIEIVKTDNGSTVAGAGDEINYTLTVTNTGNVTLENVVVNDELAGIINQVIGTLAPTAQVTLTATYTVDQADVDRGSVLNVATVGGNAPNGEEVGDDDSVETPIASNPSIEIVKTDNGSTVAGAGDEINYTLTVTNTGNVTLENVVVNDELAGIINQVIGTLAPTAQVTLTATYTVDQADVDRGSVLNVATVGGNAPNGEEVGDDDSVETPIASNPSIEIVKTDNGSTVAGAGDEINYTLTVTNTGNVTLENVVVNDELAGIINQVIGSLAPTAQVTLTATYTVDQADVDRGSVLNVATVGGNAPNGEEVGDDDSVETPIASNPSIEIVKTDNGSTVANAGDEINYTLTVTNTGNVTLENVVVNDELAGIINQVIGSLAPTAQVTLTATYTVDQADVDRGSVLNVATVGGNAPNGEEVGDDDSVETPIASNPSIEIVKTDNGSTVANAGDEINYTLTVTNTGNVTLENVVVNDELAGIINQVIGTLAPTAQVTLTATYTVDQADVDRGSVLNVATVGGNAPNGEEVGDDDSVETPIASNPSIEIVKTDNGSTVAGAGDEINYTLTVTNTGNVTLENVVVNDELAGIINQVIGTLAPTAQVTLTATYTVDQADVDRGSVLNVATVGGNAPNGEEVGDDDSVETPIASNPSIEIVKTDNGSTVAGAGDEINYTLTVTNTGNVTLENVVVNDELAGIINQVIGTLAPTAQVTLTATYTVDQADVDRGSVLNVATVGGNAPNGEEVGDDDSVETPIASNPSIEIVKTDNGSTVAGAGDEINYTLTVTNTGNVTLENVVVNDELAGIINQVIGSLAPTAQVTLTATYTVDQADVDRGSVLNVATVGGNAPNGEEVGDDDSVETPIASNPSIEIVKTDNGSTVANAGDEINYTLTVTNTGNVTLENVVVNDPLTGLEQTIGTMVPGEIASIETSYTVTQTDVDRGSVSNVALAKGEDPSGNPTDDEDGVETPIASNPGIEIVKTDNGAEVRQAGDVIVYTLTVTNTGNVTLENVVVNDPLTGLEQTIGTMVPGEVTSIETSYTVTQADVDRGSVANVALAKGEDPSGNPTDDEDGVETPIASNPGIEIVKTDNGAEVTQAGDVIVYTLTVTNTGNVTLENVVVNDPLTGLEQTIGTMVPGEVASIETSYTVTQADVDRGSVANVALAKGEDPSGNPTDDEDGVETPIASNPGIEIVKTDNGAEVTQAGDVIVYTLTVTNTGNVTLENVVVNDPLTGLEQTIGTMVPGEVASIETSYTVTQADVDRGGIVNIAFASGNNPDGETTEDEDKEETPIASNPGISIVKSDNGADVSKAGDVIVYTLTVTNTGNVTLENVLVSDPLTGLEQTIESIAPGQVVAIETTYSVTQEDVDNGRVLNTAIATGNAPDGETPEDEDEIVTTINANPAVEITKVADKESVSEAGEIITYTLTITNTGNVVLSNVLVVDPLTGLEEAIEPLMPGATVTITTEYVVTVEDVLGQASILNVATVTGEAPNGEVVENEDTETVGVVCLDNDTLIAGLIFNAETGQPLAGVPVILLPQEVALNDTLIMVTGADGRYAFRGMNPGRYLVQVLDDNLNAVRNLYPVESSLFFTTIEPCIFQTRDFGYESYEGVVLGDLVWYDLNGDGIQNEWWDANNDGQVTLNDPTAGPINLNDWEWFDLNGDGRFDGPENEGELNKAGFGNSQSANVTVNGPNGFTTEVIVGVTGRWRSRPDMQQFGLGEYTATLDLDEFLDAEAQRMRVSGLVKVIPNFQGRIADEGRSEIQCGLTTEESITRNATTAAQVHLDMDFGIRCREVQVQIIANDDDFGVHFVSFEGRLGNILENDRLNGQQPLPEQVDFEFTELDGIEGLFIEADGTLSLLIPGINEAREYQLRYILREAGFPENNDEATVVFRLLTDEVDLSVEKTSNGIEIWEGDTFEYEIAVRNIGGTDATDVVIEDVLPTGVSFEGQVVISSVAGLEVNFSATGNVLRWSVPFLPADASLDITVIVRADGLSGTTPQTITNVVTIQSAEDDVNPADNTDSDVNTVNPFFIPNVITPDGDRRNDTFEIKGINKFVSNDIVIFNRFGDHVFQTENYQNNWDAPGQVAGTFFYIFRAVDRQGRSHEFKGWIQVVK